MFLVCTVEDNVRILPGNLGQPAHDAVAHALEKAFVDRVVTDAGLVVTVYDIISIDGGFVFHSDGAAHFKVSFRLVVFRPLVGEVLTGTLKRCNREGVWVSLGFFDDVFVPGHTLQQPSEFDEAERLWAWKFEEETLFMELNEPVRLRVTDVRFNPVPTPSQLKAQGEKVRGTAAQPFRPMEVIGVMDADGLGCIAWWQPAVEEDGAMQE